jgi:hypothetical protein
MSQGTERHLEHAEHAAHAAEDPFNKRVALSMAVIAAVLASVSMLSHQKHNATLLYQTQASNQWSYYQAKKQRGYAKDDFAETARYMAYLTGAARGINPKGGAEEQEKGGAPSVKNESGGEAKAEKKNKDKPPDDASKLPAYWKKMAAIYSREAAEIQKAAEELDEKTHAAHAQAGRLDLGHLGLELALVLCAIALLVKDRTFWLAGLGVGVLGACVSLTTFLL